jgi:TPR repeat protein
VDLFLPLAESGASDAQFNLAYLLHLGLGRPQNYGDAYFWASLSALGGQERAIDLVDDLQALLPDKEREVVVKNLQERLTLQIENGDDSAPEKLARLYADFAVKPDMESAFIWFSICHALGNMACEDGMTRAIEDMPPETIVKVQAKAAEVFATSAFAKP